MTEIGWNPSKATEDAVGFCAMFSTSHQLGGPDLESDGLPDLCYMEQVLLTFRMKEIFQKQLILLEAQSEML